MMNRTITISAAAAIAATGTVTANETAELESRIAELESRLSRYEVRDAQIDAERSEQIRSIVHDVLADADTRSSFLQSGAAAGYDGGFFVRSSDGNYAVKLNVNSQFRFVWNNQDENSADTDRWGVENTRTQLILSGHVVDPSWFYRVQGNFGRTDGVFDVEDAYIGKKLDNGWAIIAGQLKVPMTRENLMRSSRQLAVERSLVGTEFAAGRTQAIAFDYRNDNMHATFAVGDGHPASGSLGTALTYDTEWSFTGRFEYLAAGSWDQFDSFRAEQGEENGLMIGAGFHYQDGEYGTAADELEVLQYTVDVSWEDNGIGVFAAFNGRSLESSTVDRDMYGMVIQGSYAFADDWDAFARYEYGDSDVAGEEDLSIITVGVNKYFSGQTIKWTSDLGYGIDGVASTWGDGFLGGGGDITGWRTDNGTDDSQIVIRSQLQFSF